jgi:Na+-driven multidrug efflux pump
MAKWMGFLSTISILVIGVLGALFVSHYSEFISSVMISDKETLAILGGICKLYSWVIPVSLIQGAFYGCLRAIGKQNHIILGQIISNFLVHYALLFTMIGSGAQVNYSIVITFGVTYASMNLYLLLVLVKIDWYKAADDIIKSVNMERAEEGTGDELGCYEKGAGLEAGRDCDIQLAKQGDILACDLTPAKMEKI